ncbi:GNAT family N-acetyltransferase [Kutzneria sp. 744]|uniref:GNAT family N-acetyltransferase n=1 Tax=Kutzneria sp. (strain 744) TaxID=345341 RepID=UPI0003EEB057|nr:GNAT family N-acetyltransferase [Kutzneria sp. 744]EWM17651.1 cell surface glycoprotein [Kutzneria sp. 744]
MILRPATNDDAHALLALYRAADTAEVGRPETSAADITDLLHAPGLTLGTRSLVSVDDTGITGVVLCHPAPQPGQLRAQLRVAPGDTATALARTLLDAVHHWTLTDRAAPNSPVTLFQLPRSPAIPALRSAGWTKIHSYTRMIADLIDHTAPPTPADVRVRPATSRADMATIHHVLETAIAGHWNHHRRDFQDFLTDQQQRDGHDTSLWLLAESAGNPVGAVIARAPADRAWIAWLGVLPEARGRGIATALLSSAFARLRDRGHTTAGVDVDTHNNTHAIAVYNHAGMRPIGTADQWRASHP